MQSVVCARCLASLAKAIRVLSNAASRTMGIAPKHHERLAYFRLAPDQEVDNRWPISSRRAPWHSHQTGPLTRQLVKYNVSQGGNMSTTMVHVRMDEKTKQKAVKGRPLKLLAFQALAVAKTKTTPSAKPPTLSMVAAHGAPSQMF